MRLTGLLACAATALMLLSGVQLTDAQTVRSQDFKNKYKLKEAVVLSRHNIRAPLSDSKSDLGRMTPHEWHKWGAGKSELTSRGGVLETQMGQYFRNWAVDAGLFPENHAPSADEVNVQANSMQRCIATAQYFTSGFMPVANLTVNHRFSPSKMDPLFNPQITKTGPTFRAEARKQIDAMGGKKGLKGLVEATKPSFDLIETVIDVKDSPMGKANDPKLDAFTNYDAEVVLDKWSEPHFKAGSAIKAFDGPSDALILQYYEEPDSLKAAFGHKLTRKDWERIAKAKGTYQDVLFSVPIVATNVAYPLVRYMFDELSNGDRKFTYLVGHDSNLGSVAAALGVEPYELDGAIEKHTPIGSKIVFEKFTGPDGTEYADVNLVYQNVDQLRNMELLNLDNPPMIYPLSLSGLERNADGLYKLDDVLARFSQAMRAYEAIPDEANPDEAN